MRLYTTIIKITKKFHDIFKDSSLFDSWEDCEKDLTNFIEDACEIAYNQGWEDKAKQMLREMKEYMSRSK